MRTHLFALLLLSSAGPAMAERNSLKPTDFEPLTSLPWKKADAKLKEVLDTIFREPNIAIRYPVLAEYLRLIPVEQLSEAFDLCIALEGTQSPDDLVEFFLPIWAKRDPQRCWDRTKQLFRVVGIEDWLDYDSWKKRPRITVQDLGAIRASRFWLESSSLISFPLGVDRSSLARAERVRIMKEFADMWFAAFGSWPGYIRVKGERNTLREYSDFEHELAQTLESSAEGLRSYAGRAGHESYEEVTFEAAMRRWLQLEPGAALEIIKKTQDTYWPSYRGRVQLRPAGPSTELFMIWAKANLPAMIGWAESLELRKNSLGQRARGFLMSRVDAERRERWLAAAKSERPQDDCSLDLMKDWAAWDPKSALDDAVASKNAKTIAGIARDVAYGPFEGHLGHPWNTSHFGLGIIQDFDVRKLPEGLRKEVMLEGSETAIMEQWGCIDVGEAARFGLSFLLRTHYAPRDGLIKFFGGDDVYPGEDGMIDRTFCALRVWAVFKPKEMETWIATLKDSEMQRALTWLLRNPWGTGPKE